MNIPSVSPPLIEKVDWPATREIRALLRCENASCRCQRESGNVHCPAHDDKISSLSVDDASGAESKSGAKSLWHCHTGCEQESVTKTLHKLVFEGPNLANAVTSTNGDAAKTAVSKTSKTLRQRGIGAETRRHFKIESYLGTGLRYPVLDANGVEIY